MAIGERRSGVGRVTKGRTSRTAAEVSQSPAAELQFDVSGQITCSKARRRPLDPMMVFKSLRPDTLNVDKLADS